MGILRDSVLIPAANTAYKLMSATENNKVIVDALNFSNADSADGTVGYAVVANGVTPVDKDFPYLAYPIKARGGKTFTGPMTLFKQDLWVIASNNLTSARPSLQ